jgi:tetratricopeptide (TPR) repeat protein
LLLFITCQSQAGKLFDQIQELANANDDLGVRILLRQNFKTTMKYEDWKQIRNFLQTRPNIGFDLMTAWERQNSVRGSFAESASEPVNSAYENGIALMSSLKYDEAFKVFQDIARQIKPKRGNVGPENEQFYYSVLHQMGRALYAQKRYLEAVDVYQWIYPSYLQIRQVMFEKMWAGFRANRIDVVLGSVASQQSMFFSKYLEPESYLVMIYVFKKLCREVEVHNAKTAVKRYIADIQSGKFNYIEWAKKDILRLSLVQLLNEKPYKKYDYISDASRQLEKQRVEEYLKSRFEKEKVFILTQLQKVLGYSTLAVQGDQKFLQKISLVPDSKILNAEGYEYWPVGDGEEWQDEIGSHVYIGGSQCTK